MDGVSGFLGSGFACFIHESESILIVQDDSEAPDDVNIDQGNTYSKANLDHRYDLVSMANAAFKFMYLQTR